MNELPDVELTQDDLLGVKPSRGAMVFAHEVNLASPYQVPPLMLAQTLTVGMSRCKQDVVKHALIESAKDLNSPIARLTRMKISKMLPPFLKTLEIENIIIKLGAIAAQVPQLWDLLMEADERATDQGDRTPPVSPLSALRLPNEASGD